MSKFASTWASLLFLAFGCGGCASSPHSSHTAETETVAEPIPTDPNVRQVRPTTEIRDSGMSVWRAIHALPGPIVVHGLFVGFKGHCKDESPTRSAWHLVGDGPDREEVCIYVSGPFPEGTDAVRNQGIGVPVQVSGKLIVDGDNRHIEADLVQR
jgi:hypothetical protein